jgi:hypothetical protein
VLFWHICWHKMKLSCEFQLLGHTVYQVVPVTIKDDLIIFNLPRWTQPTQNYIHYGPSISSRVKAAAQWAGRREEEKFQNQGLPSHSLRVNCAWRVVKRPLNDAFYFVQLKNRVS